MRSLMALAVAFVPAVAYAQSGDTQGEAMPYSQSDVPSTPATDRLIVAFTGQRQTREQVAQDAGIEPMGRIGRRIQNRVQTRIRNRVDRYYDPQANAASPFAVAGEQARIAGRRSR
ncbi:hypothetical protein [Sphingomonas xinjiangensis]|uniref:Uncharacterized protein n=1 Tax=Sphingomonas xinjiangensis TaxID=643568 RepID=A0A840YSY4_9SPHN|nr:hypothetical protein [Sphingomonas xinjiangensis]MBB5712767.1 hypothetical protein [Sphingomonas xinjiangensis]